MVDKIEKTMQVTRILRKADIKSELILLLYHHS